MNDSWNRLMAQLSDVNKVEAPPGSGLYAKPFVPINSQLNFEQRILNPSQYPVIRNEDGSITTHRMAWTEADGGYYAYPTVVQDSKNSLRQLDDREAVDYAMRSGNYRKFDTAQEAQAYADGGYKEQWGAGEKRTLLQALKDLGR